jgi:hypothetical protein
MATSDVESIPYVLGLAGLIVVGVMHSASKAKKAKLALVDATAKNASAIAGLQGFQPSVSFIGSLNEDAIAIDAERKSVGIAKAGKTATELAFSQISSVQVLKDGEPIGATDMTNSAAGAAAGAVIGNALFGGVGLVAGFLAGNARGFKQVEKLALKIYTTDLVAPVVEVVFLSHPTGLHRADNHLKARAQTIDEWFARFQAIMKAEQGASRVPGFKSA